MKRKYKIIIAVVGIALAGEALMEHLARRRLERRYDAVVEDRARLEVHVGEVLAAHTRLKEDFQAEQQRSSELSTSLTSTRGQLQDMEDRLATENQQVRKLQTRLTGLQQQMEQLQGELVLVLRDQEPSKPAKSKPARPIELERIVVSGDTTAAFKGRVMSVHSEWDFVVVNLGWNDVKIGDIVSIVRSDEVLARARIDRVQEGVSAATILPEWESATIRVNDLVQHL